MTLADMREPVPSRGFSLLEEWDLPHSSIASIVQLFHLGSLFCVRLWMINKRVLARGLIIWQFSAV